MYGVLRVFTEFNIIESIMFLLYNVIAMGLGNTSDVPE